MKLASLRPRAARVKRVSFAVFLLVVSCLALGACAGSSAPPDGAEAIATASAISASDVRMAAMLDVRAVGEGWVRELDHFTSPGWRTDANVPRAALRARLPLHADEPFEVGPSASPSLQLRVTPHDSVGVAGVLRGGAVISRGAHGPKVDVIRTTTRDSMEELLLLRDASAPSTFAWDVELPRGVARGVREGAALRFEDAQGRRVLQVPPPYAVDSAGRRRDASLAWDPATMRMDVHLDTAGLAFPVLLDPSFEVTLWEQISTPPTRELHGMAYDAGRGRVVVFGGYAGGALNDTWTWDGTTWTQAPSNAPPARSEHALAYDPVHDRVVLFGGNGQAGPLGDTWTWDGTTWTPLSPAASPPARRNHAMTYDAAIGRIVLFGGLRSGGGQCTFQRHVDMGRNHMDTSAGDRSPGGALRPRTRVRCGSRSRRALWRTEQHEHESR